MLLMIAVKLCVHVLSNVFSYCFQWRSTLRHLTPSSAVSSAAESRLKMMMMCNEKERLTQIVLSKLEQVGTFPAERYGHHLFERDFSAWEALSQQLLFISKVIFNVSLILLCTICLIVCCLITILTRRASGGAWFVQREENRTHGWAPWTHYHRNVCRLSLWLCQPGNWLMQ